MNTSVSSTTPPVEMDPVTAAIAALDAPPDVGSLSAHDNTADEKAPAMDFRAEKAAVDNELTRAKADAVRAKSRQDAEESKHRMRHKNLELARKESKALADVTRQAIEAKKRGKPAKEVEKKAAYLSKIRKLKDRFGVPGDKRVNLGSSFEALEIELAIVNAQVAEIYSEGWLPGAIVAFAKGSEKFCQQNVDPRSFDLSGFGDGISARLSNDKQFQAMVEHNSILMGSITTNPKLSLALAIGQSMLKTNTINQMRSSARVSGKHPADE